MHYDIISAFIKSMRGSDPDAAVYWLARMIDGGEDPKDVYKRQAPKRSTLDHHVLKMKDATDAMYNYGYAHGVDFHFQSPAVALSLIHIFGRLLLPAAVVGLTHDDCPRGSREPSP